MNYLLYKTPLSQNQGVIKQNQFPTAAEVKINAASNPNLSLTIFLWTLKSVNTWKPFD